MHLLKTLTEDDYAIDIPTKTSGLNDSGTDKAKEFFNSLDNLYDIWQRCLDSLYWTNTLRCQLHHVAWDYIDYVVSPEQEILIVDQFTGRTTGRSSFLRWTPPSHWSKRRYTGSKKRKTSAPSTYQYMFRYVPKLSGMTGTGKTRGRWIPWEIHNIYLIPIPTNSSNSTALTHDDLLYPTLDAKIPAEIFRVRHVKRRYERDSQSLLVRLPLEASGLFLRCWLSSRYSSWST